MGRDFNIYGLDDNDYASGIASDALGKPGSDRRGSSEGSKGNAPQDKSEVKVISDKSDSRAKTAGNHGKQD